MKVQEKDILKSLEVSRSVSEGCSGISSPGNCSKSYTIYSTMSLQTTKSHQNTTHPIHCFDGSNHPAHENWLRLFHKTSRKSEWYRTISYRTFSLFFFVNLDRFAMAPQDVKWLKSGRENTSRIFAWAGTEKETYVDSCLEKKRTKTN